AGGDLRRLPRPLGPGPGRRADHHPEQRSPARAPQRRARDPEDRRGDRGTAGRRAARLVGRGRRRPCPRAGGRRALDGARRGRRLPDRDGAIRPGRRGEPRPLCGGRRPARAASRPASPVARAARPLVPRARAGRRPPGRGAPSRRRRGARAPGGAAGGGRPPRRPAPRQRPGRRAARLARDRPEGAPRRARLRSRQHLLQPRPRGRDRRGTVGAAGGRGVGGRRPRPVAAATLGACLCRPLGRLVALGRRRRHPGPHRGRDRGGGAGAGGRLGRPRGL
ncbi:MAG: Aminoglycoside 6-phosphotransferase, putative, partial [uncultured Thermomicrobiales bacterium]